MASLAIIICVVPFFLVACVSADNHQFAYSKLHEHVMKLANPHTVPSKSNPISVIVQMGIVAIHDVDRERNEIDITRWIAVSWNANLFSWNHADYDGIMNISVPFLSMWRPDFHLFNTISKVKFIRGPSAVLFHHGMQAIFAHVRSKVHCDKLPENSCTFHVASSSGMTNDMIRIRDPSERRFNMNSILAHEEFKGSKYEILSHSYKKFERQFSPQLPDKMDFLDFTFTFRDKKPSQHRRPFQALIQWR